MRTREPGWSIRRGLAGVAVATIASAVIGVAPATAGGVSAVDITVTSTTDGGPGSLRDAVTEVAVNATGGPHTIRLVAGETYQLTICGDETVDEDLNEEGDLDVLDALTIVGNGATIEQTCPAERVLHNTVDEHLQLQDVTITGGDAQNLGPAPFGNGGGVYSIGPLTLDGATVTDNSGLAGAGVAVAAPSELTVLDSSITENVGASGGGAYAFGPATVVRSTVSDNEGGGGGGLSVTGSLVLTDSTVRGNFADGDGGGVEAISDAVITGSLIADNETSMFGYGGGVNVEGNLEMTNSTVTGNTAGENGGGIDTTGVLTLTNSRVSGNAAGTYGGGIWTEGAGSEISDSAVTDNTSDENGGGVYIDTTDVVIARSMISGNAAEGPGGGIHSYEAFVVTDSTITGNSSLVEGGGITMDTEDNRPMLDHVTLTSNSAPAGANVFPGFGVAFATVVADPLGGGDNCAAPADASAGYNFEVATDTCGFASTGDVASGPDPLLGALADNGGPTHTLLPLTGSPLIDAVPSDDDACGGTDQRSVARPQFDGCDVGAVEVAPDPPPPSPPAGGAGTPTPIGSPGSAPAAEPAEAVAARPTFTG